MTIRILASAALTALLTAPAFAAPDLASVRDLYAAASYEEALDILRALDSSTEPELIEQYRALCFLGLGKDDEAERSLERLVQANPLYAVPAGDVSPRLVALFQKVRRRSLPSVAKLVYNRGRSSYDARDYKLASAHFTEVVAIVNDPDVAGHGGALTELRELAEGFRTLSEAALEPPATTPSAAPTMPSAAPTTPSPPDAAPVPQRVYTAADDDVTAPVAIARALPSWNPPRGFVAQKTLRGTLEATVDENGAVESATMTQATFGFYDDALIEGTRTWRFRPAKKNGVPVKYRLSLEIVLLPTSREE